MTSVRQKRPFTKPNRTETETSAKLLTETPCFAIFGREFAQNLENQRFQGFLLSAIYLINDEFFKQFTIFSLVNFFRAFVFQYFFLFSLVLIPKNHINSQ